MGSRQSDRAVVHGIEATKETRPKSRQRGDQPGPSQVHPPSNAMRVGHQPQSTMTRHSTRHAGQDHRFTRSEAEQRDHVQVHIVDPARHLF